MKLKNLFKGWGEWDWIVVGAIISMIIGTIYGFYLGIDSWYVGEIAGKFAIGGFLISWSVVGLIYRRKKKTKPNFILKYIKNKQNKFNKIFEEAKK